MNNSTGTKTGWKQRLRRELFEYWVTAAYLMLYFGAFAWYRRLILAEYRITYLNYGVAIIEALVLAKVILIGDLLRLGHRFGNRPLIVPTVIRSAIFTVWIWIFSIGESAIKGLLHGAGLIGGFNEFMGKGKFQLLASSLVVFFTFIPFFAFRELNRMMGEGRIWRAFFRRGATGQSSRRSGPEGDDEVLCWP
jgi:hypothetical protein